MDKLMPCRAVWVWGPGPYVGARGLSQVFAPVRRYVMPVRASGIVPTVQLASCLARDHVDRRFRRGRLHDRSLGHRHRRDGVDA